MPITVSANQMIARALVDLRVLGIGRSVTKAHSDVAFPYLQEIVDSWKTNRWATYRVDRNRYRLEGGIRGVHPRAGGLPPHQGHRYVPRLQAALAHLREDESGGRGLRVSGHDLEATGVAQRAPEGP